MRNSSPSTTTAQPGQRAHARRKSSSVSTSGEPPAKKFACDFDGCGRAFTRSEHLQRHLLNHTAGESTCERCRAHFKRKDLLGKWTTGVPARPFSWGVPALATPAF